MNKDDFFYFGKILKTFGNKGQVIAYLEVDDPLRYKKLESVYIGIDDQRIPFFINHIEFKPKNQALIHFEDIHDASDAEMLAGREIYLPLSMLPPLKGKKFYYHEIAGFTVIDKAFGNIGILASVIEYPHQPVMQVMKGEKEILLPLTDEILIKVDRKKKELQVDAPEGLIEIYL